MELCTEIAVVIPSAGIGTRTGASFPKQFFEIEGRPVISHTVEKFLEYKNISNLIVVAAAEQIEHMKYIMKCIPSNFGTDKIEVVKGGDSRHRSILLGLKYLKNDGFKEDGIVAIHDGVRPFLNPKTFAEVIAAAKMYNAAGIARDLVSTVISLDDKNMLKEALNRSLYRASEMPQAFKFNVILKAYENCPEIVLDFGTECLDIAKTYGNVIPKLIYTNDMDAWKITYKMDLFTARNVTKAKQIVGIQGGGSYESLWKTLVKHLNLQFSNIDRDCYFETTNYFNYVIFHRDNCISNIIRTTDYRQDTFHFQPLTIVHITFDGNDLISLQSLQKDARIMADKNLKNNIISYYVVTVPDLIEGDVEKVASLVASLVFDVNRYLSGTIIYF